MCAKINSIEKFDFFEELFKCVGENKKVNDNICLISGELLKEYSVKLECGHTFNYDEIFNEVYQQKCNPKRLETQRLRINEIKCPYCRNIQQKILPQLDNTYELYHGVNTPLKYCMFLSNCKHIYKYGKRKGTVCARNTNGDFCKIHNKCTTNKKEVLNINKNNVTDGTVENIHLTNNKHYCQAIIPRGKRKGMQCLNKKKNGNYCGIHAKQFL